MRSSSTFCCSFVQLLCWVLIAAFAVHFACFSETGVPLKTDDCFQNICIETNFIGLRLCSWYNRITPFSCHEQFVLHPRGNDFRYLTICEFSGFPLRNTSEHWVCTNFAILFRACFSLFHSNDYKTFKVEINIRRWLPNGKTFSHCCMMECLMKPDCLIEIFFWLTECKRTNSFRI